MIVTTCIGCGQADDHPKHQVVNMADHSSVHWHMDCHAAASPPCGVCTVRREGAEQLRGDELRAHLIKG